MLVDVDEFNQTRVGFAFRLNNELDHVFLVIETVEQQGGAGIESLRQANVGRVALHQIGIVIGAYQLHGFDLEDLDVLRVGDDVFFGGFVADTRLEGDQAGLGQQLQASTAVDRVVGDGHAGALRQFVETFVFLRVEALSLIHI